MINPIVIRRRLGLSRPEMADKAGVSLATIVGFELDVFDPQLSIADKLAAAYGVTLNEITACLRRAWPESKR